MLPIDQTTGESRHAGTSSVVRRSVEPGRGRLPAGPAGACQAAPAGDPDRGRCTAAADEPELPPLFDDIERRTFQFFWDTTNEINGLTPDRYPSRPFASIASVGFALTAYPIGIENGWVSRNQAIDRTLTTLKFFRDVPMGPQRTGKAGYKGFYYHFLDMQEGRRYDSWVELSSVDTALLMMGVLFAQSYYDGDDPREKESARSPTRCTRRSTGPGCSSVRR